MDEVPESAMNKFVNLAGALSPENLHCDGEISQAQANAKYRVLMKKWHTLEKKIGRTMSEGEVWNWVIEKRSKER